MRARLFLAFLPLLAPFLGAGAAVAQPAQPLDRLLPRIRRDYPGQFLDAEGAYAGGNPHYHLKWLTPDGRVMWLDTDARTGRVLSQSPGRDRFDAPRFAPNQSEEGRGYERQGGAAAGNRRFYDRSPGGAPPFGQRFDNGNDRQFGNGRPAGNGGYGNRNFGNRGGGFGRNRGGR